MRKLFFFLFANFLFADITGVVVDEQGSPLDSVKVTMDSEGLEVFSDAQGNFVLVIGEDIVALNDFSLQSFLQSAQKIEVFSLRGEKVFELGQGNSFQHKFLNQPLGIYILRMQVEGRFLILKGHNHGKKFLKVSQRLMKVYSSPVDVKFEKAGFKDTVIQVSDSEVDLGNVELIKIEDSSSSIESSSSVELSEWCNTEGNCGTFIDERDGQEYRWTKIGDQIWMAENLNFKTDADSYCYKEHAEEGPLNCEMYGRLYTWEKAMGGAVSTVLGPSGVQGVCPEGWHVPSDEEWSELGTFVASETGLDKKFLNDWEEIGIALKSSTGWLAPDSSLNDFAFSALPSGSRYASGVYYDLNNTAFWWSATEYSATHANTRQVNRLNHYFPLGTYIKTQYHSVRCVKGS